MNDLKNLFETAQRIQSEVSRVKGELGGKTVTAEAGGGMIQCTANGTGDIVSITIDPVLMSGDKKMIEDLTVAAINLAIERARQLAHNELQRATGGLQIPGLFGQ